MTQAKKDTIYIDVDDEITTIIDKVRSSDHKLVALVLPKRASVLQSVVNMKLLKRAADKEKKHAVLITSEASLMPLAGSVGIHVAKTLQSKPEIPAPPETDDGEAAIDEPVDVESEPEDFDPKKVGETAVGELAGIEEPSKKVKSPEPDDTIELNEDELAAAGTIADSKKEAKKNKKNKKLKVPDFLKFRRWLILGGLILVVLIVLLIILLKALPKATISVKTNSTQVPVNLTVNLATGATAIDASTQTLPATLKQTPKTTNQQVPTTGTKNTGAAASGTITITNCGPSAETIPSGTGFTASGFTFTSQNNVTVPDSNFKFGGVCKDDGTAPVPVQAIAGGSAYNLPSGTAYTIDNGPQDTTAVGGAMSGGTDNVIKIVSQADVDSATQKLAAQDTSAEKQTLENTITNAGLYPITATFVAGTPSNNVSPSVGTQADNVTVTETITYTMMGVKKSDLQTILDNALKQQINKSQQSILNDGLSTANYNILNINPTQAQFTMTSNAVLGSQLNIDAIKKQIIGKKSADVQSIIKAYDGVVSVNVHYSPFWVTSVPSNTSKITIIIQKPGT